MPSHTGVLEVAKPKDLFEAGIVESPSKDLSEIKSTLRRGDETKVIKRVERRLAKRKPPAPPISALSENQPPVVSLSPGPPVKPSTLTVSITDPDEPGDPAFGYTMTVNWGDGTAPTILSNPHPFYQTLTHTYAQSGNWIVTLNGTDPHGAGAEQKTATLTVVVLQSLEFIAIDSPFDGNPNPGGGLRIFPDLPTYDPQDMTDYDRVRVRATLNIAVPYVTVHFRAYDVDDPLDNQTPVDDETQPGDNRGSHQLEYLEVQTNALGQADTFLHVSMQPGDNYRAVATGLPEYLVGLQAKQDDGTLARIVDAAGIAITPAHPFLKITPLLTTWRRLHVEVDSMGAEPAGTQFDPDDDLLRGDVPDPDISGFQGAFQPASILVLRDTGEDNSNMPWRYNFQTAGGQMDELALDLYFLNGATPQRGTRAHERLDYWVVYVAGIYEVMDEGDNDPDLATGVDGVIRHAEPEYSLVLEEVVRDIAAQWNMTPAERVHVRKSATLHEVGHQFELDHSAGVPPQDVMWAPNMQEEEVHFKSVPLQFSRIQLATIRGTQTP